MSRRGGGRRGGGGAAGGRGDFPRDPNPVPGGGRGRGDPSHAPAQQRGGGGGGGGGGRGDFHRDPNQASGGGRGRVEMSGGGPSYAPAPAQQRGGAVGGGGGRGDPQRGPNPVPGGGRGRGDLPGGAPSPAPEQPRGGGRGGRGRGLPVAGRGGDQHPAAPPPPQQTLTPADQASSSSPAAAAALAEQVERRLAISDPPPPAAPAAAAATSPAATALVPATPPPESSKSVRYPARPGFGTIGRKMVVRANHFLVKVASNMDYCHYDVAITPEVTSRGVNRAIMKELITLYGESHLDRKKPAYDGRKSLYTAGELPFQSKNFVVKLPDKDKSSTRPEKTFKVAIKFAARHDLHHLEQFLKGRQVDCPQETIQVLDVVMRESPSTNYTTVARSFFSPLFGNKEEIGEGMECWRGYYQSLRPTQMGLSLNIDVAATSFYKAIPVIQFISEYLNLRDTSRPLSDNDRIKVKKALRGLRVDVTHTKRRYKVAGITPAPLGQLRFPVDDKGTQMSVVQYFKEKYNYPLRQLNWPCIQSGSDSRPTYLPFEVCKIAEGQRFTKKLNDRQVTKILRLACKRPPEREKNILEMVQRNDYSKDEFAREFGIGVEDRLTQVQARVLPPPKLKYHETGREKSCSPSVGQWNMINKRMVNGGTIGTWTCLNLSRLRPDVVRQFCDDLVALGNNIGMSINPNPLISPRGANPANVEGALRDVNNQCSEELARHGITGKSLQLLIIVLPEMNSPYGKIKRICETDLGIVSQCCLPKHVGNYNKQYLENISLKINVKVGGRNTVLEDALRPRAIPFLNDRPTIIFGADVTHPPPGDDSLSSIAAVVASMDWPEVSKYRCLVSAQTHREEMIQDLYSETRDPQKGIVYGGMVREHLLAFHRSTNRKPERILFYRDGVSEGQFSHVLLHEMDQIRRACTSIQHDYLPPVTFVVVQKRHHTRLFPAVHGQRDSTDRSGNILPGTVVDTTICHPVEFDFYLCSHAGIQGTSRPTHYHVLFDENKFSADALQTLTNNLCYTYARCTRSVSVVPPAYYAHLAAFRARYYVEDESDIDSSAAGGSNLRNTTLVVRTLPKVKENVKEVMFYC